MLWEESWDVRGINEPAIGLKGLALCLSSLKGGKQFSLMFSLISILLVLATVMVWRHLSWGSPKVTKRDDLEMKGTKRSLVEKKSNKSSDWRL